MSRMPDRYLHVPRAYYYSEDAGDYSESEVEYPPPYPDPRQGYQHHPGWGQVHELVPGNPDLTELYRRKHDDRYMVQQEVGVADESPRYYYRSAPMPRMPAPTLQKHRLPVVSGTHVGQPQQVPAPIPQQRTAPYYTQQDEDHGGPPANMYEPAYMYQQPHPTALVHPTLANVVRRGPPGQVGTEATPQVANVARARTTKPAVSVRTPRYYRPQSDNVYKKPSTLCIPLATQPDPGANKPPGRLRHSSATQALSMKQTIHQYQQQQQQQRLQQQQYQQQYQLHHQQLPPNEPRGHQDPLQQIPETPRSAPATFNMRSNPSQQQERLKQIQNLMLERREEQAGGNKGRGDNIRNCEEEVSNVGDDDEKSPNFDLLLSDYQQMFNEDMRSPIAKSKSSINSRTKRKRSAPRIPPTQLLQPRLPPSLKVKKKHGSKSSIKSSQIIHESENAEDNRIEIEQMTTDVLDSLLQDLSINGLTNTDPKDTTNEEINISNQTSNRSTITSAKPTNKNHPTESSRLHRKGSGKNVHNVHEIHRTNESPRPFASPKFDETPTNTTFIQDKARYNQYEEDSLSFPQDKLIDQSELYRETMKRNNYGNEDKLKQSNFKLELNVGGKNAAKKSPWTATNFESTTPKIDDSSATELHRSKSYIVNLIDRALSRELGTIPEEKPQKQYMNLDARAALDLMSSPAAKNMDNDLCMEITHALAESLTATMNQPSTSSNQPSSSGTHVSPDGYRTDSNKKEELIYSTGVEEPVYIKQLKKLRWGHLKHIQREMRRLEDLERFLDSCGTDK